MELADLRIPDSERLLIQAVGELDLKPGHILTTSQGRGQLAAHARELFAEATITVHFIDQFPAEETSELFDSAGIKAEVVCLPDLPEGMADLVLLPLARGGDSELARDLLQEGYERLNPGGTLLTAVDNKKDTWLHHEVEKLNKSLTPTSTKQGMIYRTKKSGSLKRHRDFSFEYAFRDGEQLVKLVSRPGVFSHRKLDVGARALIETMQIKPGERVFDIGCGCGAVGLAAVLRAEGVHAHGVDSNARAVESALRGAQLNGIADRFTAELHTNGGSVAKGTFDVAVGNPPYFSNFKIAEIFLQGSRKALRPGGRIHMVTKQAEWFEARCGQLFKQVELHDHRGYTIVSAIRD